MRYKPHHGEGPTKDNPYRGMKAFLLSDDVQKWADSAAKAIIVCRNREAGAAAARYQVQPASLRLFFALSGTMGHMQILNHQRGKSYGWKAFAR